MVDYNFMKGKTETITEPTIRKLMIGDEVTPGGKKRLEFFDVDLPDTLPGIQGSVEIVRKRMVEGDKKIDEMGVGAGALILKDEADFGKATEMIGQLKNLNKRLTEAVEKYSKPLYDQYKTLRNILTARTAKLDSHIGVIQKKQNVLALSLEMQRRKDKQRADDAAAEHQRKLDADQAAIDAKEKTKAKKEKREPVFQAPIVVDVPVIPKEIKTKTESGSAKIEMVLVHTITNINSPYILKLICDYCGPAYKTLADQACKKAIKAGAIGLAGAEGITVEEKAITKHRRR